MSTKIELIQHDGKIKGWDPEREETVPVEMGPTSVEQQHIPEKDLEQEITNLDSSDHNHIIHHDGTGDVPLVDGSTSNNRGLYIYNDDQGAFVQLLKDAASLSGHTADEFVLKQGDSFNGPVHIDPDSGNALLQLLSSASEGEVSKLHLGGDQQKGGQIRYDPTVNELSVGYVVSGTFKKMLTFDETGTLVEIGAETLKSPEILAEGDGSELTEIKSRTVAGALEEEAAQLSAGVDSGNKVHLTYSPDDGYARLAIEDNGTQTTGWLMDNDGDWMNTYFDDVRLNGANLQRFAEYSDHSNAPERTLYWHSSDGLSFKNKNGNVEVLAN
jgi:hypothetical protein